MILSQCEIVKPSGVEMSKFDMSLMKQIGDRLQKAVISLKSRSVRYLSPPSYEAYTGKTFVWKHRTDGLMGKIKEQ